MKRNKLTQITIYCFISAMVMLFVSCEKSPNFREFNYSAPIVTDFSPAQGYIGSDITINGSNFDTLPKAIKVYFGGILADTVRSAENNKIVVQAPAEGITGIITVEIFGKTDTTTSVFTYLPSAKIIAVSTDKAIEDDEVTITGENFGTDISKIQVYIGENEAEVISVNPTEVKFSVPDVPSGSVILMVDGQKLTGSYLMVGIEKLTGTLIGHSGSWKDDPNTTIAAAVDGDINTFVDGPSSSGFVGYDMGDGKAAVLKSVRYAPREEYASRMMDGEIRGANDPTLSDYKVLFTITETPPEGVYTEQSIDDDESFRYIYYYSPNGNGNIAEIEFYGNVVEKINEVGKYVWEFVNDDDNEGWEPQQSGQWEVKDGLMKVAFTQATGNKRADLKMTQLPVVINTGDFPIIAIKMTRPEGARITFDTNNGAVGNGFNKYSTDYASEDVYFWDLSVLGYGSGAPRPDEVISFSTFQFKIADIPQEDPAEGYEVDWIRTFESKEKLAEFLGI